jgi:hypothetical protein
MPYNLSRFGFGDRNRGPESEGEPALIPRELADDYHVVPDARSVSIAAASTGFEKR